MKFICIKCGDSEEAKDIETIMEREKTCYVCRDDERKARRAITLAKSTKRFKCLYCNCDMESYVDGKGNRTKSFCSRSCATKSRATGRNKAKTIKNCVVCGAEFKSITAKFCSSKCRKIGVKESREKLNLQKY